MACITQPETCGPEGAAFAVWFKVEACVFPHGLISSKHVGKSGFLMYCDHHAWEIQYEHFMARTIVVSTKVQ